MNPVCSFKWIVAGVAIATFAGVNGCTTPAPKADRLVSAPAGMSMSCFRRSHGSFGAADGPVDWTLVERCGISPETVMLTIKRTPMGPATRPQGAGPLNGKLISLKLS
jgi:hypothetical protein